MPGSLFYLYEAMETDSSLAGCCGEIKPMKPNYWKIVVPAQVIEYKFAHMLDKALESAIGFITVLPGAFSAYRWEALSKGTNRKILTQSVAVLSGRTTSSLSVTQTKWTHFTRTFT